MRRRLAGLGVFFSFKDVLVCVHAMQRRLGGLGVFACFLRRLDIEACHAKGPWRYWRLGVLF